MITVAQYIASENLAGVQNLAKQLSAPMPLDSRQAHSFLKTLYLKDPNTAEKYFKQIHPDKETLFGGSYNEMTAEPMYNNAIGSSCNSCGSFKNMSGCSSCSMRNANDDVVTQIENYADKGVLETEKVVSQGVDKMRDLLKEKDDRIFKYAAMFVAGFLVCKLISK
jgi:hypothetical protein